MRAWLRNRGGAKSATTTCVKRGNLLKIAASCRRGNASECTGALTSIAQMATMQEAVTAGGSAPSPCFMGQGLCDSYYAGSQFTVGCVL